MITPEDFETLVQDTMHGVDAQTHPDAGLPERLLANARHETTTVTAFRKRSSWIAPLLAAAAVVALATTLTLASRGNRTHTPPGGRLSSPPISTSNVTSNVPTPSQIGKCLTAAQAIAIVSHARGGTVTLAPREGFACAHGWAYLNFQGPVSPNTATVDLQYVNGQWIIGDRQVACGDANGIGTTPPAMNPALVHGGCGN